jgi:hypothetical protein
MPHGSQKLDDYSGFEFPEFPLMMSNLSEIVAFECQQFDQDISSLI